jgi:hypothetical protein
MITKTDLRDLRRILALAASKDSSADSLQVIAYTVKRVLRKHDASWRVTETRERDTERG